MTNHTEARAGPLAGIRVLDFSRILSGPYATMVLADLGADVVKIEEVGKGDDVRAFPPMQGPLSHYFIALNRNKRSIALNLKTEKGKEIAKALAASSDIVIENFRPGVMDRLGLGYDVLSADHPELIYCSISGFGAGSPLAGKPAFDIVTQALSGLMSVNSEPGAAPNRLGLPMGDMAGSIFCVFGVLAALHERSVTGRGKRLDVAMLDSLIGMLGYLSQIYFVSGAPPKAVGTKHASIVPYGAFPTADGHVIVACLTEGFWKSFARCLDMPELLADPRFAEYTQRLAHREALEGLIEARMRTATTEHWLERLDAFDVPNAPILDVGEALEQEHVAARGLVAAMDHPSAGRLRMVKGPIRFDGEGLEPRLPPPLLGEHSFDVLRDVLGYDEATCHSLEAAGVVEASAGG
ncbi:CoA transferase [Acuticoccus sediminis]|uniref:CoA transferase n=1 Tax=Acuticoccus sediminis TaxID=2184697 RepID=A0A8B2P0X2_9HYPH|nr:CoA transferase [Acuticoccus sediminis]RAI02440.1 CoA transferase [Acuticoccus sediminis]